jgi:hypothetical protein
MVLINFCLSIIFLISLSLLSEFNSVSYFIFTSNFTSINVIQSCCKLTVRTKHRYTSLSFQERYCIRCTSSLID